MPINWNYSFTVILSVSEESMRQSVDCRFFTSFRMTNQSRFIGVNISQLAEKKKGVGPFFDSTHPTTSYWFTLGISAIPGSSRWICPTGSMPWCTSLACTPKCISGRGFLLKSFGIGRIIDQIHETCTRENRSADVFLYKRDLYTSRAGQTSRPTNKNAPHCCEAFGAENETRTIAYNMLIISDL